MVKADFVLDYDLIAVAHAQHLYLMARIQAEAAPEPAERRPLNLGVVLDRSGSMAGDKLDYVKQAAQYLVQRLGAKDRFALVSYNHTVTVDVPAGPVIEKDHINWLIDKLKPGGNTNLSGGWLQGCQLVADGLAQGQVNRVLLLTDGLANEGVTESARLEAMARQKRAEGITTTTMGVGMDFNEDLLTRLASEGGGAFYFIDTPDQAPHLFAEELKDLLSVVGQNLTVTLTFSPDVRLVRQLNAYPAESREREVVFRMGDLFADELKTLLLELSIPALQQLGSVEVARLRFDYDDLGADAVTHHRLELPILVNTAAEADVEGRAPNEDVVRLALLLQAARAREEAVEHADRGEFDQASQVLSNTADAIRASGLKDNELRQQHDMLREEAVDMDAGSKRYDTYSRKSFRTKAMYVRQATAPDDTQALHMRHAQSRSFFERSGPTPTMIEWFDGSLVLTDHVRIGRADDNDIIVDEPEVSSYHCEIVREGDSLILTDLNSTNGTLANGAPIQAPFRLSVEDVVRVGMHLFMFPK